jgi:hypothetical protein
MQGFLCVEEKTVSPEEHERIQKAGANARAGRLSLLRNPYLESANMPATTGDSLEEWQAKVNDWEIGWRAEDLLRS